MLYRVLWVGGGEMVGWEEEDEKGFGEDDVVVADLLIASRSAPARPSFGDAHKR